MKKHILLGAALLSLMATSCSNDDVIDNGTEVVTGKPITLNATINNGADTRLAYTDDETAGKMTVAWSTSESFTMYKGTITEGSTFSNSTDAKGTFTGDDITGAGTYYAVYGNNISNSAGTLTIDLSGAQVGTNAENGIKEFMLASTETLSSSTALTFNHKLTVLKMTLKLPSDVDVDGKVSMVTVSGLHNKASYSLSEDKYSYADEYYCAITATNGGEGFTIGPDNTITAYVAVFPETVTANKVKLIANVGFNDYAYTITNTRTLTAGTVVPVNASLALVEKNLKSAYYDGGNFKTWSDENCSSAPTADQMKMYLGAGVYWDEGTDTTDGNQQTYTINGRNYHAGLWVMKKAYISGFSAGSAKKVTNTSEDSSILHTGRPDKSEIGKYFFLPITGHKNDFGEFNVDEFFGNYWSSSPDGDNSAFYLFFERSSASVESDNRNCYYPPMIAE